jgi:hypothetical protein
MSFDTSKMSIGGLGKGKISSQNAAQEFLDVKQNYVYKGLNLNLKEVKELIGKVYQTEDRNR